SSGMLSWPHLFTTFNTPIAVSSLPVMSFRTLSSHRGSMNLIFTPWMTLLDARSSSPSTSFVKSLKPSRSTTLCLFTIAFMVLPHYSSGSAGAGHGLPARCGKSVDNVSDQLECAQRLAELD